MELIFADEGIKNCTFLRNLFLRMQCNYRNSQNLFLQILLFSLNLRNQILRIFKFSELFLTAIIEIETFNTVNERDMEDNWKSSFLQIFAEFIFVNQIFFYNFTNLFLRMDEFFLFFWNLSLRKRTKSQI